MVCLCTHSTRSSRRVMMAAYSSGVFGEALYSARRAGGVPGVVFVSIGMSMRRLISFESVRRKWLAFYC